MLNRVHLVLTNFADRTRGTDVFVPLTEPLLERIYLDAHPEEAARVEEQKLENTSLLLGRAVIAATAGKKVLRRERRIHNHLTHSSKYCVQQSVSKYSDRQSDNIIRKLDSE